MARPIPESVAPPDAGGATVPANAQAQVVLRWIGNALAALWIFGGMLFFFMRFSFAFYSANQSAIDRLLERLQR